jgi:two-component system copper resistance phosphate regulon response regulator CusR
MRILLIEDERELADRVARALTSKTYTVDVAYEGEEGLRLAQAHRYGLVILAGGVPHLEVSELLEHVRRHGEPVPVLGLTARDVPDKSAEFAADLDGYLLKPFSFSELHQQVQNLLRRGQLSTLQVGDLTVDRLLRRVTRAGRAIELTPKEYALLEYLAAHPGRVFSRTMIIENVWDQSFESLTNIVDVYVRHLRAKVDEPFATKLIRTVRGVGYGLVQVQGTEA